MSRRQPVRCAFIVGFGVTLAAMASDPARSAQPPIPDISGYVLTVRGPVAPAVLGETLMHEHIFFGPQLPIPDTRDHATDELVARQPLTLANLAAVRAGAYNPDNDFIGDFDISYREVMDYKNAGGGAVVDVTSIRLGRDPQALFKMSNATGLHIVMGGGWYQKRYHLPSMDRMTLEEMTDKIVRDIAEGVDGTYIRSGVIGEIGINGDPLTPNEIKSIRASARAARLTGAPMSFHRGGLGEEKLTVLDLVAAEGMDLARVTMGHSSPLAIDLPLARRVLARGVTLEFDWLGALDGLNGRGGDGDDRKIAEGIVQLVKEGYGERIVLSHDICIKRQLKTYGGLGYTYIHDYFLPALRSMGLTEADIHKIMVSNPARQLTFAAPRPLKST